MERPSLGRTLLISSDDSRGLVNFAFRRDRTSAAAAAISSPVGRMDGHSRRRKSFQRRRLDGHSSRRTGQTDRPSGRASNEAVTRSDCHLHKSIPVQSPSKPATYVAASAFTVDDSFYASSDGLTDGRTDGEVRGFSARLALSTPSIARAADFRAVLSRHRAICQPQTCTVYCAI